MAAGQLAVRGPGAEELTLASASLTFCEYVVVLGLAIQSRPALMFWVQSALVSCCSSQPKHEAAVRSGAKSAKIASSSPVPLNVALPSCLRMQTRRGFGGPCPT